MKMMKLTTDLEVVPGLRMYGVIPSLPLFLYVMVQNSEQGLLYLLPSLYVISMGNVCYDMIYIFQLQLCSHPVAVVQYTYTHKQYMERHKTNNT
jgi:hypothetical protein